MIISISLITLEKYSTSLLAVIAGLVIGYLAEKLLIPVLIRFSLKTKFKHDDYLFESMKGLVWPIFLLGGITIAIHSYSDFTPQHILRGDKAVSICYILLITFFASRFLSKIINIHTYDQEKEGTSSILVNLVRTVVFSVGIMIALQNLGISIQPLLTALGITGLAVALALQSTLSNFFSGLHIIASRRLRPGDFIRIDTETEGYISDINWRSTTIRKLSGNLIIIPNSKLADAIVTNTYMPDTQTSMSVECVISHNNDLVKVEKIVLEAGKEMVSTLDGCVKSSEPSVSFQVMDERGIRFALFLKVNSYPDQFRVRHECIKRLHQRFREERIELPVPVQTGVKS
ncbi:MAG: mechanosensitive ion channel family protein [Bacteroidetes bacterium]|nr:mechanosensitive ion channel family protein [Bacteroidota bacterium]